MLTPEIDNLSRYRAILATSVKTREALTTLHQHDADGREYDLTLLPSEWNVVPGRPGLLLYVIPHPLGGKSLWMTAFYVAPHATYTGSHINERRLISVLEGEITCNGRTFGPGQSMLIEPRQSTDWVAHSGASGVVLYEIVEPDMPPTIPGENVTEQHPLPQSTPAHEPD